MEQFEQLLTCCVCLDRYRNPKLLPCQHSFCMECMDGLVDYVRRQVKCPECRAEHRIPYQGVQGFPTNVTLTRFLELHIEITGELPDPLSGQTMERCNVCSEKAYCASCMHCDKKICPDCKGAHMDILRREINRINNQIRRGTHRLQDALSIVEKNSTSLQANCHSVSEEIDEMSRRLTKALKDRTDYLRTEMDRYLTTEMRNLTTLKENLELEIANITSNCDLADKHMTDAVEWDDCELMDTKEIFLRTVEFIRNFECENSDYSRRVRFTMAFDPNQQVNNLSTYADLNITHPAINSMSCGALLQAPGPGLSRSKSDHRLATQFRQQQESTTGNEDEPLLGGRKFGERPPAKASQEKYGTDSKYGRGTDYDYNEYENDSSSTRPSKSRFRSRFVKGHQGDSDDESTRSVKFDEKEKIKEKSNKVSATEDCARGPLSGIFRIQDSPRVMQRLQEQEKGYKDKKEAKIAAAAVKPVVQVQKKAVAPAARQVSEDDEITRIKKQNKSATSSQAVSSPPVTPTETEQRPVAERVSILKKTSTNVASDDSDNAGGSPARRTTPQAEQSKSSTPVPAGKKPVRAASVESSSSESSGTSPVVVKVAEVKPAEVPATRVRPTAATTSSTTEPEKKPFQSRFLHPAEKKEESESSSEEDSSSEESEEEEDASKVTKPVAATTRPTPAPAPVARPEPSYTTRAALLKEAGRTSSRDEPSRTTSGYGSPTSTTSSYTSRYDRDKERENETAKYSSTRARPSALSHTEPEESSYTSRFLNKSKSTAVVPPDDDEDSDSKYGSGRSRYMALKERRTRLARSRSSHNLGDDDEDEPVSPTTQSPSAYLAARYGTSSLSSSSDLSRSKSSHALKSREPSPDRSGDKDGAALSSWARYLKSKYGSRSAKDTPRELTGTSSATSSSSTMSPSTTARRLSLGLPLRQANEMHSSDDDSKNGLSSPTSPTVAAAGTSPGVAGMSPSSPRTQYLQKRRQLFQIGGRGSEPASFTWPRGIAVGPDNSVVVADSSNHRVQVFDSNGIFVKEFGQYGNNEGEFDCLAGVAVNRIGQFIIADRYNHRIQVLDPAGRFLRAFGSQGTADGKFNYPWGITTDALGFIYVCDKENHRIQVFQSDGTFVGKFGTCGSGEGQLEHPHYIAVSNTNRVIVSDSNNHRIQIFDVNGRVLSTFGSEGSEEGQFKFPRGVAVDDQGFICVADSGNNRIQIFHADGTFLRAFGSWGSGTGEFKGLEGVAIMSNGNILVCDRENHRVQVF